MIMHSIRTRGCLIRKKGGTLAQRLPDVFKLRPGTYRLVGNDLRTFAVVPGGQEKIDGHAGSRTSFVRNYRYSLSRTLSC